MPYLHGRIRRGSGLISHPCDERHRGIQAIEKLCFGMMDLQSRTNLPQIGKHRRHERGYQILCSA